MEPILTAAPVTPTMAAPAQAQSQAQPPTASAPAREVRLAFERGNLLLRTHRPIDAAGLPGTVWDFAAGAFRAPARQYAQILDALRSRQASVVDRAREGGPAPAAFTPPRLRPSEAALLEAWDQAGRRGLMVLPPGAARRRVAFAAIARSGLRSLCIVPARPELMEWAAAFHKVYGAKVAELGDAPRHEITPVSIATLGVAHRRMCELGSLFDLVIADEAQDLAAGARGRPMDESIAPFRLGFLGGPPRQGPSLARLVERMGPVLKGLRAGTADEAVDDSLPEEVESEPGS